MELRTNPPTSVICSAMAQGSRLRSASPLAGPGGFALVAGAGWVGEAAWAMAVLGCCPGVPCAWGVTPSKIGVPVGGGTLGVMVGVKVGRGVKVLEGVSVVVGVAVGARVGGRRVGPVGAPVGLPSSLAVADGLVGAMPGLLPFPKSNV